MCVMFVEMFLISGSLTTVKDGSGSKGQARGHQKGDHDMEREKLDDDIPFTLLLLLYGRSEKRGQRKEM